MVSSHFSACNKLQLSQCPIDTNFKEHVNNYYSCTFCSESFQARVELLEDKVIRGKGEPYLKILLSQKGGSGHTISAIAVGDAYLFAKRTYKVSQHTFVNKLFYFLATASKTDKDSCFYFR